MQRGIVGVGALITFAMSATGFDQAFPGLDLRLLTLAINFYFPFTREVLMALGINSVTKESVVTNLTRAPGASAGAPTASLTSLRVGKAHYTRCLANATTSGALQCKMSKD